MNTNAAKELVDSLKLDDIRSRLDELASEEKALRVLLRAASARNRQAAKPRKGVGHASSPSMLTPPVVAKQLAVKPDRVIAWIRAGRLRAINVGDGREAAAVQIDPSDLADFLESRRVQPPAKRGRRPRVVASYPMIYPET